MAIHRENLQLSKFPAIQYKAISWNSECRKAAIVYSVWYKICTYRCEWCTPLIAIWPERGTSSVAELLGCALVWIHIHSGVLALSVSILQCVWAAAWANFSVYAHTSVDVSKFVWVPLSVSVTSVIEWTWSDCQNADTQVQSFILSSSNALFHQQLVHPSSGSRSRQVVFELKLVSLHGSASWWQQVLSAWADIATTLTAVGTTSCKFNSLSLLQRHVSVSTDWSNVDYPYRTG